MAENTSAAESGDQKPATTMPGTVEKVIKSLVPGQPEKVQISLEAADHLYREIRVENNLTTESGTAVALKVGAQVDVTIEADAKDTVKKDDAADKR